eukprot:scaffold140_cov163-Amphora_coffeaeformis.AAC.5
MQNGGATLSLNVTVEQCVISHALIRIVAHAGLTRPGTEDRKWRVFCGAERAFADMVVCGADRGRYCASRTTRLCSSYPTESHLITRTIMSSSKKRRTTTTALKTTTTGPFPGEAKKKKKKISNIPSYSGITCEFLRERIQSSFASSSSPKENDNRTDLQIKCDTIYLTDDHASWILLVKQWFPCPDETTFEQEWNVHPPKRHLLKLFGRTVSEKRWSQSWGVSYAYSGATNPARAIPPASRLALLLETVNQWVVTAKEDQEASRPYNACLQNWYEPDDTIGRHADDEREMRPGMPIFSLSWGGTRRFVLRAKHNPTQEKTELFLQDGDLLVMGGTTQETHYHEVPKRRVTMDPPTSRRINWTLRSFRVGNDENK